MKLINKLKLKLNILNITSFIVALVAAYIFWPIYFEAMIFPLPSAAPLWMSLDPSWLLHLNFANMHNLEWGKDIVFTYGPLSYLSTKVGWGQNKFHFLLYDFFVSLNFFLLLFLSFRESKYKIFTLLIIVGLIIVFPLWVGATNALMLMAFLIFWIIRSLDKPKITYYFFQVSIMCLVFFMKFNTGLIAFPLFFAGIGYNLINHYKNKRERSILLGAMILPFIVIPILASVLNVALLPYAKYGIEMVSGYNDVMYMDHPDETRHLAFVIIVLTSLILISKAIRQGKEGILKNLTIIFLFGTGIFVMYKQSFVRGMEVDFFIFSVLLILATKDMQGSKMAGILSLICVAVSIHFIIDKQNIPVGLDQKVNKLYLAQYKNFSTESGLHLFPNNNQLPELVKQKIKKNTVDVYPWNIQMLFENKLNLSPRPGFQAYQTYSKDLEEMNFEHYNSSKAPEFVIYDFTSIDSRYPLFDEPRLNLILSRNYFVSEIFDFENRKVLLLQKKKNFKPIKLFKMREYAMMTDSPLVPKKDIFYEVEVYYTMSGILKGIFDHAPEIQLDIYKSSPNPNSFKTSKHLLQSGLFSDTFISTTTGFGDFVSKMQGNNDIIKCYRFRAANPECFTDKFKVSEYKIVQ